MTKSKFKDKKKTEFILIAMRSSNDLQRDLLLLMREREAEEYIINSHQNFYSSNIMLIRTRQKFHCYNIVGRQFFFIIMLEIGSISQ